MSRYRVNFYDETGKLFAYYSTNNKRAAEDMRDSKGSCTNVEMVENEYVTQRSACSTRAETF